MLRPVQKARGGAVLLLALLTAVSGRAAQVVSTLATRATAGVSVDSSGNVYFGDQEKGTIFRLSSSGILDSIAQLDGDIGDMALDRHGNLYVARYNGTTIVRIQTGTNTVENYVTGISGYLGPWDVILDGDTLFFLEYATQRLWKVLPGGGAVGSPQVIAVQGQELGITGTGARVSGMAILPNGNFVVTCVFSAKMYEVDRVTGAATVFADVPDNIVVDIVRTPHGEYFYGGYTTNKIYRLDIASRNSIVLSGTGTKASVDGPIDSASFNVPYCLATDRQGNLYVSQWGDGKLRKIDMGYSASIRHHASEQVVRPAISPDRVEYRGFALPIDLSGRCVHTSPVQFRVTVGR